MTYLEVKIKRDDAGRGLLISCDIIIEDLQLSFEARVNFFLAQF